MAKQLQVKLKATNTTDQVHVPGLGSLSSTEWTDVSEAKAERFKRLYGKTVKQATDLFETQIVDVKDLESELEPEKEEDK